MENSYQNSTTSQIIDAIINQLSFEGESKSDIADILLSILKQTPYEKEPNSVIAELFIKLKAKIEGESFEPFDKPYISNIAEIIKSILDETEYNNAPNSRIAELLLELKEELEAYVERTASGAVANFTTSLALPLVSCEVDESATKLIHQNGTIDVAKYFRGLFLGTHNFMCLGDFNWNCSTEGPRFFTTTEISDISLSPNFSNCVANGYNTISSSTPFSQMQNLDLKRNGSTGVINIKDTSFGNNTNAFKTAMQSVYLIYELATPTTPTITSEQYQTLLTAFDLAGELYDLPLSELPPTYHGEQNIFTDNGDVNVTYKAMETD